MFLSWFLLFVLTLEALFRVILILIVKVYWGSQYFVIGFAEKYVAYITPRCGAVDQDLDKLSLENENGFLWDTAAPESNEGQREEGSCRESTSEVGIFGDAFYS